MRNAPYLWCGEGVRVLGLEGQVSEEDIRALCRCNDPVGKRFVDPRGTRDKISGLKVETHREGNDYC